MSCSAARSRFSAFVERDLPAPEVRALTRHISVCRACASELSGLREALAALQDLPRAAPTGAVASAVLDRIEVERRGPGLQLLFRPAWRSRPQLVPSLVPAVFLLALAIGAAVALDSGSLPRGDFARVGSGHWRAPLPASGTEANPLLPSAEVALPQPRTGGARPQAMLPAGSESSFFFETVVARDGSVSSVELIDGDTGEAEALADTLRHERFEPARVGGRPVAVSLYRLFSRMEVRARST